MADVPARISSPLPSLPDELVLMIVHTLRFGLTAYIDRPTFRRTLCSTCLVCKHWSEQLRPTLWHDLRLESRAALRELVRLVSRPQSIMGTWIREIWFIDPEDLEVSASASLWPALAVRLPNLAKIDWMASLRGGIPRLKSSTICAYMARFKAVTNLFLGGIEFLSLQLLMRVVSSFPLLEALKCAFVEWISPHATSGWSPHRRSKTNSRLSMFTADGCPEPWMLLWLFSTPSAHNHNGLVFPRICDSDISTLAVLLEHLLSALYKTDVDDNTWEVKRFNDHLQIFPELIIFPEIQIEFKPNESSAKELSNATSLSAITITVPHIIDSLDDLGVEIDWKAIDALLLQFPHLERFQFLMSDRGEVKTTLNMRPFYSFSLTLADRMPLALQTRRLRMSLRSSVHGAPVVDHVPSQADALVLRELQDAEKEKRRVQRRLKQLLAGPTAANMRREQRVLEPRSL